MSHLQVCISDKNQHCHHYHHNGNDNVDNSSHNQETVSNYQQTVWNFHETLLCLCVRPSSSQYSVDCWHTVGRSLHFHEEIRLHQSWCRLLYEQTTELTDIDALIISKTGYRLITMSWLADGCLHIYKAQVFTAWQHISLTRYMLSSVRPSVCPSDGWISQ